MQMYSILFKRKTIYTFFNQVVKKGIKKLPSKPNESLQIVIINYYSYFKDSIGFVLATFKE